MKTDPIHESSVAPDSPDNTDDRRVTFTLPNGLQLSTDLNSGESVAEAALRLSIRIRMSCGGSGRCDTCRMEKDGKPVKTCMEYSGGNYVVPRATLYRSISQIDTHSEVLSRYDGRSGCAVVSVTVPDPVFGKSDPSDVKRFRTALAEQGYDDITIPFRRYQAITHLLMESPNITAVLLYTHDGCELVGVGRSEDDAPVYTVGIDIGTTTIVAELINSATGRSCATASCANGQSILGEDVASRIAASTARRRDLQYLVVQESISPLIDELCFAESITRERISVVSVSGNSVMTHMFFGWPAEGFGRIPFNGVSLHPPVTDTINVGLVLAAGARLVPVPCISAYVGGDLTSGVVMTGLHTTDRTVALVDVGTNCEIILAYNGKLYGCSTPAGPAFEGNGISCGIRAQTGAIERVCFTDKGVSYRTIGDEPPAGLCGSALLDILGQGLLAGIFKQTGRFKPNRPEVETQTDEAGKKTRRLIIAPASESADGYGNIYITEQEISLLMQAKSAIFSGFLTLLNSIGLTVSDVEEVFLAGGFARHVDLNSAVACGMLPDGPALSIVGNTSLAGASNIFYNRQVIREMHEISHRIEIIELNLEPTFQDNYIDALFLPNQRESLFPSIVSGAITAR